MSLVYHRDIATFVELALTGVMDGRVVNIADEAPTTLFEIAGLVGATQSSSAEPLTNPWMGRIDASLARSLGFHPKVRTVYHAIADGAM